MGNKQKEPNATHKGTHKVSNQTNLLDMIEEVDAVKKLYELRKSNQSLSKQLTGDWEKDRFEFEKIINELKFKI